MKDMVSSMAQFIGPALIIPLQDPLMSLVDVVCIGQFSGTTELAAMGPAQVVFGVCQYSFQGLQVATIR
jgi:Na+-driven multidrug efflux pump